MPHSTSTDFRPSSGTTLRMSATTAAASPAPLYSPAGQCWTASSSFEPCCSPFDAACESEYVNYKRIRHNDHTSSPNLRARRRSALHQIDDAPESSPSTRSSGLKSPMPLINSRYRLAGGLDNPLPTRLAEEEHHELHLHELDYRGPNRSTSRARQNLDKPHTQATVSSVSKVPGARKRALSANRSGWSRAVMNSVGGIAGRFFTFCWISAFRGFQAGGGQAYGMDSEAMTEQNSYMRIGEKNDLSGRNLKAFPGQPTTPIPGQFPEGGFIHDYMSHPQAYQAREPPQMGTGIERNISRSNDNWVIVDIPGGTIELFDKSKTSPCRLRQARREYRIRPSPSGSGPSFAGSPGISFNQSASFASPRGSPRKSCGRIGEGSPRRRAGHRHPRSSAASPRQKTESGPGQGYSAAASPEVQRYEKRIRRQERKGDKDIQRLNKQLQDMIKQGKQALGTKIEIESDSDDDGDSGGNLETISGKKWGEVD